MEEADTETLSGFHAAQIKETAKRLSIVGKIDELKLEKHSAKATAIDEIFVK